MKRIVKLLTVGPFLVATMSSTIAQHAMPSNQEAMDRVKEAAPPEVVKGATILNMADDGQMKPIQAGKNGWTCMVGPDGTPMCADQGAMEWVKAWTDKGPAPQKIGFIYMLRGDSGASNIDPYATKETPDNYWIQTGSHVMIVGAEAKSMMQAYPRDSKADTTKPYVMWPGTPYEHLMLPVK